MHTQECIVPCFSNAHTNSLFSQRLLPIEGANDLFFQPPPLTPTSKVYTIRPYFPKDEVTQIHRLFLFSWSEELISRTSCYLYFFKVH